MEQGRGTYAREYVRSEGGRERVYHERLWLECTYEHNGYRQRHMKSEARHYACAVPRQTRAGAHASDCFVVREYEVVDGGVNADWNVLQDRLVHRGFQYQQDVVKRAAHRRVNTPDGLRSLGVCDRIMSIGHEDRFDNGA